MTTLNTIQTTAVETNNGTITEYDPEFVEYSLLASLFFTPEAIIECRQLGLETKHFSRRKYGLVYQAILDVSGSGQVIDLFTVEEKLGSSLNDVGGRSFLLEIITGTAGIAYNAEGWTGIIKRSWAKTRAKQVLEEIARALFQGLHHRARELMVEYESLFASASATSTSYDWLLSAADILTTDWPKPEYIVPGILPVGLTFFAGKPKSGKSWLALQLAFAVGTGGQFLNTPIPKAKRVLYLALEDTNWRLKERMIAQTWPMNNRNVDFVTPSAFQERIGNLQVNGAANLTALILSKGYSLVIVDTLARAMGAVNQCDPREVLPVLSPLQTLAQQKRFTLMFIDHMPKITGAAADVIQDVYGSVSKTGVADTIWGLYRERSKRESVFQGVGRDIQEFSLAMTIDWATGLWHSEGDYHSLKITERRNEILTYIRQIGEATNADIARFLGSNKGSINRELAELVDTGYLSDRTEGKNIFYSLSSLELPSSRTPSLSEMIPF